MAPDGWEVGRTGGGGQEEPINATNHAKQEDNGSHKPRNAPKNLKQQVDCRCFIVTTSG